MFLAFSTAFWSPPEKRNWKPPIKIIMKDSRTAIAVTDLIMVARTFAKSERLFGGAGAWARTNWGNEAIKSGKRQI